MEGDGQSGRGRHGYMGCGMVLYFRGEIGYILSFPAGKSTFLLAIGAGAFLVS